jgi:hypothetical protein
LDCNVSEQHTDQLEADQQSSDQDDAEQKKGDQDDAQQNGDRDDVERYESGQIKEAPEPTDEHKNAAEETAKSYIEERPTTVLPGSDGTVTGTAVNDWIDDDGNPVHGDIDENRQEAAERDRERNEQAKAKDDEDDEDASKDAEDSSKDDEESSDDEDSSKDAD